MPISIYLIVDCILGLLLIVLAVTALLGSGYKKKINILFGLFSLFVALWIGANHLSNNISYSPDVSLMADFVVFASAFMATFILTNIIVDISENKSLLAMMNKAKWLLIPIAVISATPLVVAGVELQQSVYGVKFGPMVSVYALGLMFMIITSFVAYVAGLKGLSGLSLQRLKAVGLSLSISMPLVALFGFVLPYVTGNFIFTEFGITPIIFLVGGLYYGAVKHQLFDIKLAAMRGVAYILTITTLGVIYYGLAYLISSVAFKGKITEGISLSPVNIALALVLALLFQPFKKLFDRLTNTIFYRHEYDPQKALDEVGSIVAKQIHIRPLLNNSLEVIRGSLKPVAAKFILVDETGEKEHSQGFGDMRVPHSVVMELIRVRKPLFVVDMLDKESEFLQRQLQECEVSMVVQLDTPNGTSGYLLLGERMNGLPYGRRDIDFISVATDELAVAIENAQRYEEIQELNLTLQEKVEDATAELKRSNRKLQALDKAKDEFISMASHQLRTPLTTIKGYVSMLLDGDAGKVSPQQQKLLEEAFNSSQRMVYLIGDFLNISRIQTGRFQIELTSSNLANVLADEIEQVQVIAESRGLKLEYDKPANFPEVLVDEDKIRQVMMNFIDNAIYYSKPEGKIKMVLSSSRDFVEFKVIDDGIGVPKDEQHKLFVKFSRASNARRQRPDGTGIGLFMAKKVIVSLGGSIIFHSVEGKGSTFGFRLNRKQ